tara:strand:+ start:4799 stop:5707 length:909 start_codon:yes stop_codon:yes gene_type:complete
MKRATGNVFRSDYGFLSPNFSVDSEGNITAASINTNDTSSGIVDFAITDINPTDPLNIGSFWVDGYETSYPSLTLERGRRYTIGLTFSLKSFYLRRPSDALYSQGLIHSDGSTGDAALGKKSGSLSITVPVTYTDSTIRYTDVAGESFGVFNIVDPAGQFGSLDVTSATQSLDALTGALTVAGGVGIVGNLNVAGSITTSELLLNGVGIAKLESATNLELSAGNKIVLKINSVLLGSIDSTGLSIPINNATIDDTPIGAISPSTAAFTSGTLESVSATDSSSITNKKYVDSTATALAIAFGI